LYNPADDDALPSSPPKDARRKQEKDRGGWFGHSHFAAGANVFIPLTAPCQSLQPKHMAVPYEACLIFTRKFRKYKKI